MSAYTTIAPSLMVMASESQKSMLSLPPTLEVVRKLSLSMAILQVGCKVRKPARNLISNLFSVLKAISQILKRDESVTKPYLLVAKSGSLTLTDWSRSHGVTSIDGQPST